MVARGLFDKIRGPAWSDHGPCIEYKLGPMIESLKKMTILF